MLDSVDTTSATLAVLGTNVYAYNRRDTENTCILRVEIEIEIKIEMEKRD